LWICVAGKRKTLFFSIKDLFSIHFIVVLYGFALFASLISSDIRTVWMRHSAAA
jgi:hypothetical protein